MRIIAVLVLLLSCAAHAQFRPGYSLYKQPNVKWAFPPNNLHIYDTGKVANITEQRFNEIIDDVMKYWTPIAQAKGVTLTVDKKWNDSTVNAYANQSGKNWMVAMFGGLARRPEITEDGFALVVCHELGHHFGGYSFYGPTEWAAAEGEADFFATNVCAKAIWGLQTQRNMAYLHATNVPPSVTEKCHSVWGSNPKAEAWCIRTAAGGFSLAHLLSVLGGKGLPSFDTPDQTVVSKTNPDHPEGQCRLDTYFAGALCNKKWDMNVIPAKGFPQGQDTAGAELEAMKYSCFAKEGFKLGTRPACWFKALN